MYRSNSLNIQKLSNCRLCGNKRFKRVILLKNMPFTDQFIGASNFGEEFLNDIEIVICESCGITQNIANINMEEYYSEYAYSVSESEFANKFMKKLAEKIKYNYFYNVQEPSALEIGSSSGRQLKELKNLGFKTLGVEPSKYLSDFANSNDINTINSFFNENIKNLLPKDFKKVGLIISSYTFDHIQNPNDIIKNIWEMLNSNGLLVIEVHDLDLIVARNEFCLFEHEHFIYFNQRTMSKFLSNNGFKVLSFNLLSDNEKRANSLLVIAQKINEKRLFDLDISYEISAVKYLEQNIFKSIEKIDNRLIENKDKKIVAYGAGGRGVMTLAALKNSKYFNYIVDKNPKGKNLYTPKSHLKLFGIKELQNNRTDIVIIFSYGYYDEIVEELSVKYGYKKEQFVSLLEIMGA